MIEFSIVIPCRNEVAYIGECLESIFSSDYPREKLEVLVCDGISNDGTREIVREKCEKYPQIKLVNNNRRITPVALNIGIKESTGKFIMILGAHAKLTKEYISLCLQQFEKDSSIGCVGGVIDNHYENKVSEIISKAMSASFGVGNAYFRTGNKEGFVDTVAFGTFKREVFLKVGLFDEELVRNQDDEFSYRLISAGFKIYLNPMLKTIYYARSSHVKLFQQYMQYGYWKVYVNLKHRTITTFRQLIPFFFVLYLLLGIPVAIISLTGLIIYAAGISVYLLTSLFFAIRISSGILDVFRYFYVFLILHVSYGWGYLNGISRFLIMGKRPSLTYQQLSR